MAQYNLIRWSQTKYNTEFVYLFIENLFTPPFSFKKSTHGGLDVVFFKKTTFKNWYQ